MFKMQMQNFTDILIEKEICKAEDRDIIIHGLTSGIELIFNVVTTILLGLMFGLVVESMVFLISFSLIRMYAGGYHCKKASSCYIMSSLVIMLVLAAVKFTPDRYILLTSLLLLFVSISIIIKSAPVGTETKPVDDKEKHYFKKKVVLHLVYESILVSILFLLNLNKFGYVICLGILVSAVLIFLQLILFRYPFYNWIGGNHD